MHLKFIFWGRFLKLRKKKKMIKTKHKTKPKTKQNKMMRRSKRLAKEAPDFSQGLPQKKTEKKKPKKDKELDQFKPFTSEVVIDVGTKLDMENPEGENGVKAYCEMLKKHLKAEKVERLGEFTNPYGLICQKLLVTGDMYIIALARLQMRVKGWGPILWEMDYYANYENDSDSD